MSTFLHNIKANAIKSQRRESAALVTAAMAVEVVGEPELEPTPWECGCFNRWGEFDLYGFDEGSAYAIEQDWREAKKFFASSKFGESRIFGCLAL